MKFTRKIITFLCEDSSVIAAVHGAMGSLDDLGLEVVSGVDEACDRVIRDDVALVLVHQDSVGGVADVTHLLRVIADTRRPIPTLVLSDRHRAEQALVLLRAGVADYLSRPLDLGRLTFLINMLTIRARLIRPPVALAPQPVEHLGDDEPFFFLPTSETGRMMEQVRRVASQDTTILLGGETGTGKTRLARLIHEISPRRALPFLVVNCGALSSTLIESEMFGHVKGAFTGADRDRTGKFAEVGRGTLLLDEIDALPMELQAKLLRAVEERVFEPVGSNRSLPMQARLIAASNRPLEQEAAAGRFRSDLYYRLNVMSFVLPPLRDRSDLIPHLSGNFVAENGARIGRQIDGISAEAMRALRAHHWPGNIRELRNVLERAAVLCPGREIDLDDLPPAFHRLAEESPAVPSGAAAVTRPSRGPEPETRPGSISLASSKAEAEIGVIAEALHRHDGNRLRAAAELGISRWTLYKKLNKYGLTGTL